MTRRQCDLDQLTNEARSVLEDLQLESRRRQLEELLELARHLQRDLEKTMIDGADLDRAGVTVLSDDRPAEAGHALHGPRSARGASGW